jgi:hypothetical protein
MFSYAIWRERLADMYSYGLPYHGLSGLQVGFLVAFTQLIPEHQIQVFGIIKMRVKVSTVMLATNNNRETHN